MWVIFVRVTARVELDQLLDEVVIFNGAEAPFQQVVRVLESSGV